MDDLALLRLQIAWGADEALEDAPVDRLRGPATGGGQRQGDVQGQGGVQGQGLPLPLREGEALALNTPLTPPPFATTPVAPTPGTSSAGIAPGTPTERALAAAGQAQSVDELRAALAAFDGCALRDTAANLVFAAGDPDAALLLIGDQPGEAEDRSGTPFAGPDGALLDRMLASAGLTRDGILLSPLLPWRPPGGRPPSAAEIAVCLPFLHRLIALVAPRRVVLAGVLATRSLLGSTRRRSAPSWVDMPVPGLSAAVPALVMPSPRMLARTPSARRDAWAALRLLRRTLDADLAKM